MQIYFIYFILDFFLEKSLRIGRYNSSDSNFQVKMVLFFPLLRYIYLSDVLTDEKSGPRKTLSKS